MTRAISTGGHRTTSPLTLLAAAALAIAAPATVGCTSAQGGGGGAAPVIGGKPDVDPCNPDFHNEGCFHTTKSRVKCDATAKKWTEIEKCGDGQYCKLDADPNAGTTAKKVSSCAATAATGVATDTATAGGDATIGVGDGTTAGGDGPSVTQPDTQTRKPTEILACTQIKCTKELAACEAAAACKKMMDCVKGCTDGKCVETKCKPADPSDPTIMAIVKCMSENECWFKSVCGDGLCFAAKESETTCAQDCKKVQPPLCNNNGKCDSGETKLTCPVDCMDVVNPPACNNNGKCDSGETKENCPNDCKTTTGPVCGDGKCEGVEPEMCPQDCTAKPVCGNAKCDEGESSVTCAKDCGGGGGACGDLKCTAPESATSCALDCDSKWKAAVACAQSVCGSKLSACTGNPKCGAFYVCTANCKCNESCMKECSGMLMDDTSASMVANALATCITQNECPQVCPTPTAVCGNGKCEAGETATNCKVDCGAPPVCNNNGKCDPGETTSNCPFDCKPTAVCGNGTCEAGETAMNCPPDCGGVKPVCGNGKCEAGESNATCAADCPAGGKHPCDDAAFCGKGTATSLGCYCDDVCVGQGDCCADSTGKKGSACTGSTCAACQPKAP